MRIVIPLDGRDGWSAGDVLEHAGYLVAWNRHGDQIRSVNSIGWPGRWDVLRNGRSVGGDHRIQTVDGDRLTFVYSRGPWAIVATVARWLIWFGLGTLGDDLAWLR